MKQISSWKIIITNSFVLLFNLALYAQTDKPLLTDNELKNHIDSTVHKFATIYMHDSNANGISIGIYKMGKNIFTIIG